MLFIKYHRNTDIIIVCKTALLELLSQCNLWLFGLAGHIIIKTRKNPEDLTEVRVLTAFQRIANKNCLHDLLIFWRSKPVWLLFWHCRLHIESESVRGVRWEKKYGGKLSWLQLLPFILIFSHLTVNALISKTYPLPLKRLYASFLLRKKKKNRRNVETQGMVDVTSKKTVVMWPLTASVAKRRGQYWCG